LRRHGASNEAMKVRRSMPSLWAALSVVWIVFWAWQRNIICELNLPFFGWGPRCLLQFYDLVLHAGTLAVLLGPPTLVGLIGRAAFGVLARD
jgi:hypothetical protein